MATVALSGIITPSNVVTATSTTTLTNKTISGASNTLTNIPLSTAVTGTLPIASGGTNSSATATAGGVAYGTGTAIAVNSAGTSGYLLQSNGASAPSWVAASAGALTFLSTVTISNSATADVETTFDSTYNTYMIVGNINTTTATNPTLNCRLKIGGSYVTANYAYQAEISDSSSGLYSGIASTSASEIVMSADLGANAAFFINFVMYVQNPTSTAQQKAVFWTGRCRGSSTHQAKSNGQGAYTAANTALTGVRFFTSAENLVSGTIRLYGIANS